MGPYVHRSLTLDWAREEGLSEVAETVAQANAGYDYLRPGRLPVFWPLHLGPFAWVIGWVRLQIACSTGSPETLGRALHGIQDYFAHGWLGEKHMLYRMRVLRRHPDIWDDAPAHVRRHIERSSRRALRRFARCTS